MEKEKESSSFRYILVMYIILVAVFVPLFLILRPTIIRNIEESGIVEKAKEYRENGGKQSGSCTVALVSGDDYVFTERTVTCSSSDLHSLLEALLLPLSDEERKKGLSSSIPEGTRLVGATAEDGFFFVSLSDDFLESGNLDDAYDEIKKTLESRYFVESLTVICGDKLISF
jgi:spore germination protein GerM